MSHRAIVEPRREPFSAALALWLCAWCAPALLGATVQPGPIEWVNDGSLDGGSREPDVAVMWGDAYPQCWRPQSAFVSWIPLTPDGQDTQNGKALKNPYTDPWDWRAGGGGGDPTVAANPALGLFHGAFLTVGLLNDLRVFQVDPALGPQGQNGLFVPGFIGGDRTDVAVGTARGFGTDPLDPLYTEPGENLIYDIFGPSGAPGSLNAQFTRARNGGADPTDWLPAPIVLTPNVSSEVPRLVVDPSGMLHVAYTTRNRPMGHVFSTTDGSTWSVPETIAMRNRTGLRYELEVDGSFDVLITAMIAADRRDSARGIYVTYHDTDDCEFTDVDVFLIPGERDPATGQVTWGPKINVSNFFENYDYCDPEAPPADPQIDQFFPMLYVDDRGYLHFTWMEAEDPDPLSPSGNPTVTTAHVYWSAPTVNPPCPGGAANARTVLDDSLRTGAGTSNQTQIGEYMGLDGRANHVLAAFPSTLGQGFLNRHIYSRDIFFTTGDLDGNGNVDLVDFATFVLCFGSQSCDCPTSDLNDDGLINLQDFATFSTQFGGTSCAPAGLLAASGGSGKPQASGVPLPLHADGVEPLAEWCQTVLGLSSCEVLAEECRLIAARDPLAARAQLHAAFAEFVLGGGAP